MSGARIHWRHVNDTAAIAYEALPHPYKDRARAWVSVIDSRDLHRCMIAIERALEYGTVAPEVREVLASEPGPPKTALAKAIEKARGGPTPIKRVP